MFKSLPKKGIPVFVYETLDKPVAPSCNLFIQHVPEESQLTFRLQFELDGYPTLALLYHADNLNRQTSASQATIRLPGDAVAKLARNGSSTTEITQLFLSLKQTCPIQLKVNQTLPTPRPEPVPSFRAFVGLAKAKDVHVLFDQRWLPVKMLGHLLKNLAGFSRVPPNLSRVHFVDWTVLAPGTLLERSEQTFASPQIDDLLPSYDAITSNQDAQDYDSHQATISMPPKASPSSNNTTTSRKHSIPALPQKVPAVTPEQLAVVDTVRHEKKTITSDPFRAQLLKAITSSDDLPDLLEKVEEIADNILKHAADLRNEADEEFRLDVSNYRMELEDEKEQLVLCVKKDLDDLFADFNDKKAHIVQTNDDDISELMADFTDKMRAHMEKMEAEFKKRTNKVYIEALLKMSPTKGNAKSSSGNKSNEFDLLQSLDEQDKLLDDEYKQRMKTLEEEKRETEAYYTTKKKLLNKKYVVLKRKLDAMSGQ